LFSVAGDALLNSFVVEASARLIAERLTAHPL